MAKRRSSKQLAAVARLRGRPAPVVASSRSSGGGGASVSDSIRAEEEKKIAEMRGVTTPTQAPAPPKKVIIGIGKEPTGGYFGVQLAKGYTQEAKGDISRAILQAQRQAKAGPVQETTGTTTQAVYGSGGQIADTLTAQVRKVPIGETPGQTIVYAGPGSKENTKLFQYPFFSGAGQRERLSNVWNTLKASVMLKGVRARTGEPISEFILSDLASNPYLTALAVTGGIGTAGKIAKAAGSTGKLASVTTRVIPSATGRFFLRNLPRVAFTGVTTFQIGSATAAKIGETQAQKNYAKQYGSTILPGLEAYESARRDYMRTQPWYKQTAEAIPGIRLFLSDKDVGKTGAERYLASQGITGPDLKTGMQAIENYRWGRGIGEAASFLATSTTTELIGRSEFAYKAASGGLPTLYSTGKKFWPLFKTGFAVTAPLGIIEAGVQESLTQQAILEKPSAIKIGEYAAIGGASAGILGGLIVGFTPFPKTPGGKPVGKAKRTAVEAIGYLADPYEWLGDITATGVQKAGKGITGAPVLSGGFSVTSITPSIASPTVVNSNPLNIVPPMQTVKASGQGVKTTPQAYIPSIKTLEPITVYEPTITYDGGGKRKGKDKGFGTFTGTPTDTDTPADTGIPTDTITDVISDEINNNITNNTYTNTDTQTNINTPTSIMTFTSIPTFTPILRYPPPFLPPSFGGLGAGGGSTKGRKRSRFVNEVAAASMFLQANVKSDYSGMNKFLKPKKEKKKKGKKKKSQKKKNNDPLGIMGNFRINPGGIF